MSTGISWTDETYNPWRGCAKISPGCSHCYAEGTAKHWTDPKLKIWGKNTTRSRKKETSQDLSKWTPYRWNREAIKAGKRMKVFCLSMGDFFEDHKTLNNLRPKMWKVIRETLYLDWQLLTKRPENISVMLPDDWGEEGYPNVWLGTSIENNDYVWRAEELIENPAVIHFISYEPALGPLDDLDLTDIEWLIYGGESGPRFRPDDKRWARDMWKRCRKAGVAFFYKQDAAYLNGTIKRSGPFIVKQFPQIQATLNEIRYLF